jgi:hypothetical protein
MRVVSLTSLILLATVSAPLAAPYRIDPRHHQEGRPNAATVIPPGWRLQSDRRYVSPDGSSWFAPHASPVGSEPITAHMDRIARQEGETITYFRREPDWIAVSGFKGGRIFYRKAVLACGGKVWHHIEFEYPAALKRRMDPFVNRASYGIDHAENDSCREPRSSPMGSKTIAKSEKAIVVKKESPPHRNASTRTKIVASPITVKTPPQPDGKSNAESKDSIATKIEPPQSAQADGKSNAESKDSIATKIEPPQSAQADGKSNAESKDSIATKIEPPQSAQADGKSNAESKDSIATKIETPQPVQSDGKSNAEANMKSIAAKTETSQSSQLDDESVTKKAKLTIAAKMENPESVVFIEMKRAVRENALGNSIDTICGRVRGKLVGDTGDRPFVYVVQKDEAYIGAYTIATTEYRKICN